MKHLLLALVAFLLGTWLISCNPASAKNEPQKMASTTYGKAIPVEGTWKLVWASYNDTLADMNNHFLVKMFTGGAFSLFIYDSTGKIKTAGYGKYDFQGNEYHETFLYHNIAQFVGGEDWQDLEVRKDTMYLNGFTRVVVGGKQVTSGWMKVREKLVRVKW